MIGRLEHVEVEELVEIAKPTGKRFDDDKMLKMSPALPAQTGLCSRAGHQSKSKQKTCSPL